MTNLPRIAFYAPIKPPHHPIPSGDRIIAQNLMKALEMAGFDAHLASEYICYSKKSHKERFEERKSGAIAEANRLVEYYNGMEKSDRPEVWITYHPYCKSPDWIGPIVTKALGIPYVTIEAAKASQRGDVDEWAEWRAEAQAGIKQADLHLVFKPSDRDYLKELLGSEEKLLDFPTFVDLEGLDIPKTVSRPSHWDSSTPVIVTAGMMRKGKKDKNFFILAELFEAMLEDQWNLIIVGGGPEEAVIHEAFSAIPSNRLHWTGQIDHGEVLGWMNASDLFVWPGWREPIGMVYLEAGFQGIPSIAYKSLGVPLVVEDGETGLLAPEGDMQALAANTRKLLNDAGLRSQMGEAAKAKVIRHHGLEAGAERLREILADM